MITYHPIARIHQKSLKLRKVILLNLEKVSRKIFASILESYLEDILWTYYLKLLNAKIVHLFLVSCKKVFPENMNWFFSAKILFSSHLLNLDIMRVMMEESWLILEVNFIWKMNKSGVVWTFHAKVIIRLEIVYRQCIQSGERLSMVHGSRRSWVPTWRYQSINSLKWRYRVLLYTRVADYHQNFNYVFLQWSWGLIRVESEL